MGRVSILLLVLGCGSKTGLIAERVETVDARADAVDARIPDAPVVDVGVFEPCVVSPPTLLPTRSSWVRGMRLSGGPGEEPLLGYTSMGRVEVLPLTRDGEARGAPVDLGPGQLQALDHDWNSDGHVLLVEQNLVGGPSEALVVWVDVDGRELERVEVATGIGRAFDVASNPTGVTVQTLAPEEEDGTRLYDPEVDGWTMRRDVAGRRTLGISTDRSFEFTGITWLATRGDADIDVWEYFSGNAPFPSRRVSHTGRLTQGALEGATVGLALDEGTSRYLQLDGPFGTLIESMADFFVVSLDVAQTEEDHGVVAVLNDEGSLSIEVVLSGMYFQFRRTLAVDLAAPIAAEILSTGLVRGIDADFLVAWPEESGVVVVGIACVGFGGP